MKNRMMRVIVFLACLVLALALPMAAWATSAPDPVNYLAWDGAGAFKTEIASNYTVVTAGSTNWTTGMYVVNSTVTVNDQITVTGEVGLILCDGYKLTANSGIIISGENTLNIYGQDGGTGNLKAVGSIYSAAIGGLSGSHSDTGTISIHGGTVKATSQGGAGIGGGIDGKGGKVTVYGGTVTATGGRMGAGIGGGNRGKGGTVTIYGGAVTATGGQQGAGIGGGNQGEGGSVTISGGKVTATGGEKAAGIGGGSQGKGATVTVYGGEVTASGGENAAGIGGGNQGGGKTVAIFGGTVRAKGGSEGIAGIGKGESGEEDGILTLEEGVTLYADSAGFGTESPVRNGPVVVPSEDLQRYVLTHAHNLVYTASGTTITAVCTGDCPNGYNTDGLTVTLNAPAGDLIYNGSAWNATASGYPASAQSGLEAPEITYYKSAGSGSTETDGAALSGAPSGAGNYVAQMAWGGAKVSLAFTVAEKAMTVSAPDVTADYDGNPHGITVSVNDPASGAEVLFKDADGEYTLTESPAITNVADSPLTVSWQVTADNYVTKSGSAKVTLSKAAQAAPAVPEAEDRGPKYITLKELAGGEYSMDNEEWQDSPVFTGLEPDTEYTFYQRLKEDANHEASPSSTAKISTTAHVHAWSYTASGATITATCANRDEGHVPLDDLTATLTISKPEHAVYDDGKSAEATVTGSIEGVDLPAVVYQKGTEALTAAPEDAGTYKASITLGEATAFVEYEIAKATQDAPAAPEAESRSATSITLAELAGGEYSADNENWADSRVFTDLNPDTEYTFWQRLKEDDNHEASPSSSAKISTTSHVHDWSYSASGAVLTVTCGNTDGAHEGNLTASLTISKPEHTVYGDGKSAEATVTGSIEDVKTPEVVYQEGTKNLTAAPEDSGSYKASITLGEATASVEYEIGKAAQAAPAAPEAESTTSVSVTLKKTAGYQYCMENTNWQNSNVFDGLTKDTEYVFYQRIAGDGNHDLSPSSEGTKIRTDALAYTAVNAEGTEQTSGAIKELVVVIKRSEDDEQTFGNYTGAEMDGKAVPEKDTEKAKGSLVLTVKKAYMETLAVGDHTLKISFSDGSVTIPVKIKAAEATPSPTPEPTPTATPEPTPTATPEPTPTATPRPVPKTGDGADLLLWGGIVVLGIIGLIVTMTRFSPRKKRK